MLTQLATHPDLKYSTDKVNWTQWQFTADEEDSMADIITLDEGEKVYLKGINPNGFAKLEEDGVSVFVMTGIIAASGDIGTITDEIGGADCVLADGCYTAIFSENTSLTVAPSLPATTLAEGCYIGMFSDCTSLTAAPALPATTLADSCYEEMFNNCTFQMSDDGTTFNFDFGATLPQTVGEDTFNTHKDVAIWMENTNGFNE